MYLWRRLATPQWWIDNEEELQAHFGDKLAVIERVDRKLLQIEIVCDSRDQLKEFGGRIERLKRFEQNQKTKPIKIGKRRLTIPAGLAFGTGDHATTALSLRLLKRIVRAGDFVVDLGTGSGILALAARCLGAKCAIGIDNDAMAIKTAKENARRNKIDKVKFELVDLRSWKSPRKSRLRASGYGGQVDIVTANLFSELLIEILPRLKRSRYLILSGIMRNQERDVVRALKRNKIDILDVGRRGKWVAILAKN